MPRAMVALVVLVGTGLAGCDLAEDFSAAMESGEQVKEKLSSELGGEVRVGWNIHNGSLQRVSVQIPPEMAGGLTLGELKARIAPIVKEEFEDRPGVLQITLAVPGERL